MKRHFTKNFYKKRTRDFYRKAEQMKKKTVVEYGSKPQQDGQAERRDK